MTALNVLGSLCGLGLQWSASRAATGPPSGSTQQGEQELQLTEATPSTKPALQVPEQRSSPLGPHRVLPFSHEEGCDCESSDEEYDPARHQPVPHKEVQLCSVPDFDLALRSHLLQGPPSYDIRVNPGVHTS